MNSADTLFLVASGQIGSPAVEMEVGGATQKFEGREAVIFALGILTGLKASDDDADVKLLNEEELKRAHES